MVPRYAGTECHYGVTSVLLDPPAPSHTILMLKSEMSSGLDPIVIVPIVLVVGAGSQYVLLKKYDFRCANCGDVFSPSLGAVLLTPHRFGTKRLTCPKCGETTWATRVPKR
jgi:predicted RNA-binding Zn-ribbon protein involved in translation (DUF1610 family)